MSVSLRVFSSFFVGQTSSLVRSSPTAVKLVPGNLRPVRTAPLVAAALNPAVETKQRKPRGIMKPRLVSTEMQAFLGGLSEIPRTQALKEIWAYIKEHNLQDPEDKKETPAKTKVCCLGSLAKINFAFVDPVVTCLKRTCSAFGDIEMIEEGILANIGLEV